MDSGFKGYDFDANQQPARVLEWETRGGVTYYTLFARGRIAPVLEFCIGAAGQRADANHQVRSWITHLYPRYPKLTHPGFFGTAADVIRARKRA